MDYKEYKKASTRHLLTCKYLLNNLETDKNNKNHHLHNIYYLSGYIIETALSYAFFSNLKHKGHVEDSEHYHLGFKTHSFYAKIDYMNKCNNGPDLSALPFIYNKIQDNKITALFNGWSTDLRYFYGDKVRVKDIDQELLSKYLKYVEEFLTLILRRF